MQDPSAGTFVEDAAALSVTEVGDRHQAEPVPSPLDCRPPLKKIFFTLGL